MRWCVASRCCPPSRTRQLLVSALATLELRGRMQKHRACSSCSKTAAYRTCVFGFATTQDVIGIDVILPLTVEVFSPTGRGLICVGTLHDGTAMKGGHVES
ncbi:hypothetical protein CPSG_09477 [Coccidioides posadasii str. Silveira]|uniref:Uncharacterized protein n=1 Tax=Coccidioides posadasii (strain RMSCC 757 / Silveira) TaxID=443226 RepID=E9DI28_COCPS|nr:hypothetical protein CPSG_09477 [Coccidioides posadasii str. Silveira]